MDHMDVEGMKILATAMKAYASLINMQINLDGQTVTQEELNELWEGIKGTKWLMRIEPWMRGTTVEGWEMA